MATTSRPRPEGQQLTVMSRADAAVWRALAAELGYLNTRGTGTGEMGNIKSLLHALAQVAQTRPYGFRLGLHALLALGQSEEDVEI